FDGCRLGVALDGDQAHQLGAVFAGHLLPGRLAHALTEVDLPVLLGVRQEDAPAVFLHGHEVEVGPAVAPDGDRGAQVDVLGGQLRAEILPPVEELRLPTLQSALETAVAGQVDVVRDAFGVVDGAERPGGLRGFADS